MSSTIAGSGLKRDYSGLLDYWQMLRRHPGAVVLATILGGVLAFLLTLPSSRVYQAHTSLEIQGLNDEFLNMRNVNPTATEGSSGLSVDIQTQVKILQSNRLLERVRQKLEAQPDRPSHLQPSDRLGTVAAGLEHQSARAGGRCGATPFGRQFAVCASARRAPTGSST